MEYVKKAMVCRKLLIYTDNWHKGTQIQKEGTAVSSLVSDFLEKKITIGASDEEEKAINNIAYTVYGGEPLFLAKRTLELTMFNIEPAASDTVSWLWIHTDTEHENLSAALSDNIGEWIIFLLYG